MQNLRAFSVVGGLLLVAFSAGCNEAIQGNCPKPIGVYTAQYALIQGNCTTDYQPFALKFEADDPPSTTYNEIRLADVVTTETLVKGCELKLGQRVTGGSAMTGGPKTRSALTGTLGVVNESSLSGTVVRTEFMDDGLTIRCSSQYDAWYTRDDLLLGAAARN